MDGLSFLGVTLGLWFLPLTLVRLFSVQGSVETALLLVPCRTLFDRVFMQQPMDHLATYYFDTF
jgi:hypothetical protein